MSRVDSKIQQFLRESEQQIQRIIDELVGMLQDKLKAFLEELYRFFEGIEQQERRLTPSTEMLELLVKQDMDSLLSLKTLLNSIEFKVKPDVDLLVCQRKPAEMECLVCFAEFEDDDQLNTHQRLEHADYVEEKDRLWKQLDAGNQQAIDPKSVYRCHQCQLNYQGHVGFRQHLAKTHGLSDIYKCPQCSKTFKESRHLAQHIKDHCQLAYEKWTFLCPYTQKSLHDTRTLAAHICKTQEYSIHSGEKVQ